jgi:hypothetical protein
MTPEQELREAKETITQQQLTINEMQQAQKYQMIVGLPGYGPEGVFVDPSQLVPEGGSGGGGGDDSPTFEADVAIGGDLIPYLIHGEPA